MVSSLGNLCGIPALVVLSNHPDVKETIFSSSINSLKSSSGRDDWIGALQSKVSEILKENSVPDGIIPWHCLPFIGIEMLKWATYLQDEFDFPMEFIKDFIKSSFFTSRGLLDEEKAVRKLLNEPSLSSFLQYNIACDYCLEDIAQRLWQQFHNTDAEFQNIFTEYDSESPLFLWTKYFVQTEGSSTAVFKLQYHLLFYIGFGNIIWNDNFSSIKSRAILESRNLVNISSINSRAMLVSRNLVPFEKLCMDIFTKSLIHIPGFFENCNSLWEMQLSRDISIFRDIVLHLSDLTEIEEEDLTEIEEIKSFLCVLKSFLIWPYQDFFMKTAMSVFHMLSKSHFYCLMQNIANATMDPNLNQTYNYRHLLREFWIKSNSGHKQYFLIEESFDKKYFYIINCCKICIDSKVYLLQKIITSNNFSHDDEINFKLILENATFDEKEAILKLQGESCVSDLILKNKFELVDMYLNTLTTREDIQFEIKKEQRAAWFSHNSLLEKESFDVADKFVNWIVSPDEVGNLKKEIFHRIFCFSDVARAVLSSVISVAYLDKLLEWFGKTDEEVKEWKAKGKLDYGIIRYFFFNYDNFCLKQFDNFLEWLNYTEERRSNIKSSILEETTMGTILSLFTSGEFKYSLYQKLLFLCSNKKERLRKYVMKLEAFAKNNIKKHSSLNSYYIRIETGRSTYKFKSNEVKKIFSNLKIFKEQILKDCNENI